MVKAYGNLINRIQEEMRSATPEIGMGVTEMCYSDRHAYDARSISTTLATMLAITKDHLGITGEGFKLEKEWQPIVDLFKAVQVPKAAAMVINQALDQMKHKGVISDKNLWQAIELWAADYLAGE